MTREELKVGLRFRTNSTPRGCHKEITRVTDKYTDYETVYPNGMHPGTSGPTDGVVTWLSQPHIGLEILS